MKINLQNIPVVYVEEMLGVPASARKWENPTVPPAIHDAYDFSEMVVHGKTFLLLMAKPEVPLTPRNVTAHVGWFAQKLGVEAVYVARSMSTYGRKQLVAGGVPFIVPGTQLYLPTLGMTFHDRTPATRAFVDHLSPVAQVAVLGHVLGRDTSIHTATELAARFGYTKMSAGRAIEELAVHELIEVKIVGREKRFEYVCGGWQLWEKAQSILQTPVKQRLYHKAFHQNGLTAGLSALAEKSDLVAPSREVHAIGIREWRTINAQGSFHAIPQVSDDGVLVEMEVWRYDPRLLSDGKTVDPFSLYLSMEGTQDERVEAALKQLLENSL